MKALLTTLLLWNPLGAEVQDPPPPAPAASRAGTAEGFGRATSYRTALAEAIEEAVGKAKGIDVRRGPSWRSRMSVVTNYTDEVPNGWFDGQVDREHEWVQQQIEGFVTSYEVVKKAKADDGFWEVTVAVQVAAHDPDSQPLVVEVVDNTLGKWQFERFQKGAAGGPFARDAGTYVAPAVNEHLRRGGLKIVAAGRGVVVTGDSARDEREKAGHRLVASHRIELEWQPMLLRSEQEKPNKARPTPGPRREYLVAGSVAVRVRVVDLVQGIEVLDLPMSIPAEVGSGTSFEQRDAAIVALANRANATVAETVYFALRPPVVTRKMPADDGKSWLVEVKIEKRIAATYAEFVLGNNGTLVSPDWQTLGAATLVGGTGTSCTFRLDAGLDIDRVVIDATELRPKK